MEFPEKSVKSLADVVLLVNSMKRELETVLKTYNSVVNGLIDNSNSERKFDFENIKLNIKSLQDNYVLIEKKNMEKLQREIRRLKDSLPKTLNRELLSAPAKLMEKQQENDKLRTENRSLEREFQVIKKRYDSILSEVEQERQDNADLRQQISELTAMSLEQSEYCARLGGATCALLWRVSQNDDIIQTMLSGDSGKEFIKLAGYTLDSYTAALNDDKAKVHNANNEHHFVLALIGVVTNLSASAFGREFLISCSHGKELLEIIINMLKDIPMNENVWMKMRNLCLKTLYNVSINQKGLKFICTKKELVQTLWSIIDGDKCSDNRIQTIRLFQSIIYEPDCIEAVHSIVEMLDVDKLRALAQNSRGEVQSTLEELITDLRMIEREQ